MAIFEMYNTTVSCTYDFYDVLFCNNVNEKKSCFTWKDMHLCNLYIYIFTYLHEHVKNDVMRSSAKRKMKRNRTDNVRLKRYKWIEMSN